MAIKIDNKIGYRKSFKKKERIFFIFCGLLFLIWIVYYFNNVIEYNSFENLGFSDLIMGAISLITLFGYIYLMKDSGYLICPHCNKSINLYWKWRCDHCHEIQPAPYKITAECDYCKRGLEKFYCDYCKGEIRL